MTTSLMPNIDTQDKADRVNELAEKQNARHRAIVNFVLHNKDKITSALKYAMEKGVISDEKEYETDDLDEVDIADALQDCINQFQIANHKMINFMATGEEDTTFPAQR